MQKPNLDDIDSKWFLLSSIQSFTPAKNKKRPLSYYLDILFSNQGGFAALRTSKYDKKYSSEISTFSIPPDAVEPLFVANRPKDEPVPPWKRIDSRGGQILLNFDVLSQMDDVVKGFLDDDDFYSEVLGRLLLTFPKRQDLWFRCGRDVLLYKEFCLSLKPLFLFGYIHTFNSKHSEFVKRNAPGKDHLSRSSGLLDIFVARFERRQKEVKS